MSSPDALTLQMLEHGGSVDPVERRQGLDCGASLIGDHQFSYLLRAEPVLGLVMGERAFAGPPGPILCGLQFSDQG